MNNFLGYRALVLGKAGRDRTLLLKQLERLGIDVRVGWPVPEMPDETARMVFLDVDSVRQMQHLVERVVAAVDGPSIALLGSDTPSVVEWAIGLGVAGCLIKPIRNTGILATLIMAYHTFDARREAAKQLAGLRLRLKARPIVCTALIKLMREFDLHEDIAYQMIRTASMEHRLTIENFAAMLVSEELSVSAIAPAKRVVCRRSGRLRAGGEC
jgi:AmiR/NasT family two-component response regulator